MTKLIIMRITEAEAERLSKPDWEISVGHGVIVPKVFLKFEGRLRETVAEARAVASNEPEASDG